MTQSDNRKCGAGEPFPSSLTEVSWQFRLGPWLLGLLILSGLIVTVAYRGEIESFAQLVNRAAPAWLIAAVFLQIGTYFSTAAVWFLTLRRAGMSYRILPLVPLRVAKLFSDQALRSGAVSGTAFFVAALNRRGVPTRLCMAALLVSLVSYYTAYFLAAVLSLALLRFYHAANAWIMGVITLFCVAAGAIPSATVWLQQRSGRKLPTWVKRIPGLNKLLESLGSAPGYLLRDAVLLTQTTLFQASIFLLDSATLWVMLRAVGQEVSFLVAFPCFVVASVVATLGPIPLGLGTFEATCVAMRRTLGVSLEAALIATLLLRGFTLRLPMPPGLWLAKRELIRKGPDSLEEV
jgi:glycosyltransferase 2 family protein